MSIAGKQHSDKSRQLVLDLRQRFLEDYDNNKDLYNEEDVNRVRENDWYVKRFLLARRRNLDESYAMLRDAMRWRQEFGLPTMKDSDFPLEFYKVGGIFPYERDIDGNVVIYMRIRMHRKIAEMADPVKRFLMHIINKTDIEVDGNGMVIVFDCSGAGYSNMDLDFLTFLIGTANSYFPVGLKYILVYELSWLLNAFRRIAMALIPQTFLPLIKFANKNDIKTYISGENLPDFMDGACRRNYRHIPKNCTTVAKLAIENGFTQSDIDRILPVFEPLLEEADQAMADNNFSESFDVQKCEEIEETNESNDDINESSVIAKVVNQKTFCDSLGIFPKELIHFSYEFHSKTFQSYLFLQNLSQTPIAYKIQSNNPHNYSVSPRLGVIMKGANLRCNIQLMSGQNHCIGDKFLILALPISDHKINVKQFADLWKDSNNYNKIISQKLKTNINENKISLNNMENNDLSQEILCLREWCNGLEKSQRSLYILLYVMSFAIVLLLGLVIYSHSYNEFFSLKSETIRKFGPKNLSDSEL